MEFLVTLKSSLKVFLFLCIMPVLYNEIKYYYTILCIHITQKTAFLDE